MAGLQTKKIKYRSIPDQSRFGWQSWLINQEECYTPDELQFRQQALNARQHSHLDAELIQTANTWFHPDLEQAFLSVNSNSWLLNQVYKPRQSLSRDDFHIPLISNQFLKWRSLGTMTRVIGDYLIIRNQELSDVHLNQPMNYILLDLAQILKRLATHDQADFVANQLQLLSTYLREIEIHVSPFTGSDRLFLADSRRILEQTIQSEIEQQLQTQQLKVRLQQVRLHLNRIAELRHTVLHFALTANAVNPHPYWEHFNNPSSLSASSQFPTVQAKLCQQEQNQAMDKHASQSRSFALETLANCPGFKFIEPLENEAKLAYSQAIQDLQQITQFQDILQQLLAVFEQTGELFAVMQFREHMLNLLQSMDNFISDSQETMLILLNSNTNVYHQYIQDKQDLSWWEKKLTSKQLIIDNFINNQDNLARFSASAKDLQLANKDLQHQLSATSTHLQQASTDKQWEQIGTAKELVQDLMQNMQQLLKPPYYSPRLADAASRKRLPTSTVVKAQKTSPLVKKHYSSNAPVLWQSASNLQPRVKPLALPSRQPLEQAIISNRETNDSFLFIGLIYLLPVVLILAYLIYKKIAVNQHTNNIDSQTNEEYQNLLETAKDKFVEIAHLDMEELDADWAVIVTEYKEDLERHIKLTRQGQNQPVELKQLVSELDDLLTMSKPSPQRPAMI